jgi:hypothetical protein
MYNLALELIVSHKLKDKRMDDTLVVAATALISLCSEAASTASAASMSAQK